MRQCFHGEPGTDQFFIAGNVSSDCVEQVEEGWDDYLEPRPFVVKNYAFGAISNTWENYESYDVHPQKICKRFFGLSTTLNNFKHAQSFLHLNKIGCFPVYIYGILIFLLDEVHGGCAKVNEYNYTHKYDRGVKWIHIIKLLSDEDGCNSYQVDEDT